MTEENHGEEIPSWLAQEYRRTIKPMNKYYNALTINVRQFTLFGLLLLKRPELFLIFELVVLNIVFVYGTATQERRLKQLVSLFKAKMAYSSISEKDRDLR